MDARCFSVKVSNEFAAVPVRKTAEASAVVYCPCSTPLVAGCCLLQHRWLQLDRAAAALIGMYGMLTVRFISD